MLGLIATYGLPGKGLAAVLAACCSSVDASGVLVAVLVALLAAVIVGVGFRVARLAYSEAAAIVTFLLVLLVVIVG